MDTSLNYHEFLEQLKKQIETARLNAVLSVNAQMLQLYWWIGNSILNQQTLEGWGSQVIKRIAIDLRSAFPDMKGISERNLKYMRAFAAAYPSFVQVPLAQIETGKKTTVNLNVQGKLAQITWYHHITLLDKVKDEQLRYYYIEKTIENGWSRDVMVNQIASGLHLRQGRIQHNFPDTLPVAKSDLARELFKDPYKFDFFQLTQEANERELEDALINHIHKFLLELGIGFAFMGRQVHLEKGGQDYYLDMLFYHTKLHCHVILELKIGDFKPEYAGKMNFYLSAFDEDHRTPEDGATIGIILCKNKNRVTAEYALRDVNKPMGIAEYQFTHAIPENLKAELPSIEDLEVELEKEIKIPKKPIDEKLDRLNKLIEGLGHPEIQEELSGQITRQLFNEVLFRLKNKMSELLEPVFGRFREGIIHYSINGRHSYLGSADLDAEFLTTSDIHEIGLGVQLQDLKKGGVKSFNWFGRLSFYLEKYKYQVGPDRMEIWEEHLYHEQWTNDDYQQLAEKWAELIIEGISMSVENISRL